MLEKYRYSYHLPEVVAIREHILNTYSNKLQFVEETHQYFLDGVEYDCVSNVTHKFQAHVDFDLIAKVKAKREGIDWRGLKQQWDDNRDRACAVGNTTHEFGESYFYYAIGEYDKILPSCKCKFVNGVLWATNKREEAIVKFWEELPPELIPVLAETKVFNTINHYAGTFDILFYYKDPKGVNSGLVILDYKSNADLDKNFAGKTLLAPFNELLDMPISLYKLQLSAYQIPLEIAGLKVIARRVIWILDDGTYEKRGLESYVEQLKQSL